MSMTFGDMLLNRRRELGLSIQQVANTIKMRPQIIEYFETNNFAAMPQRGYAQGMISSYARFLGLNPREVVDAYYDGLYQYEKLGSERAGRLLTPATDASPRSSNATGRFMMVGGSSPSSRFAQRPPQAGYVPNSGAQELQPYDGRSGSTRYSGRYQGVRDPRTQVGDRSGMNGRQSSRYQGRPRSGAGQGAYAGRSGSPEATGRLGRTDRQQSRAGSSRQQRAGGYGSAQGRGRQQGYGSGRGGSRGGRGGSRGRSASRGFSFASLLSSPKFVLGCLAAIAVLLILVIILVFRSCTAGAAPTQSGTVKASLPLTDIKETTGSGSSGSGSAAGSSAVTVTDQTLVTVNYTGDGTAWIEIKLDGEYTEDSGNVTEGFSKVYTVTDSIEITTDNPSDVEILKNGEKQRYDTKSSGVGKITITAPNQSTDESSDSADAEQTSDASSDETSTDEGATTEE